MAAPTQTPKTKEEFEAVLKDQSAINDLFKEGKFGDFVADYAQAHATYNLDIQDRVEAEVQRGLAAFLKENGGKLNRPDMSQPRGGGSPKGVSTGKGAVYNAKAPGAAIDRSDHKPEDMAEFLQATWHHRDTLSNSDELKAKATEWKKIQNSFGTSVPSEGGFLVPEEMRSELLKLSLESSIVRPRATVIPMSSQTVPIPSVDETSHASSVFGGIIAYWTEEGAQAEDSDAKFGRVKLEARKLVIYCEAPNELVADAPAFGGFLDNVLPQAIAFYEDDGFINGSGAGEPLGWANADAMISVDRAGSSSGTITWADLAGMYSRMLPSSLGNAVWVASPETLPALLQMVIPIKNVAGTENVGGSSPALLTGGNGVNEPPLSILGRPVIISEKVQQVGTSGDINFVDLGYYLIGDRQTAQATSSPHFKFRTDETAYKIIERVDGRPWLNSAITPKNGGDSLSPFVKLTTA